MSIKSDSWIRRMALEHRIIEPFVDERPQHRDDERHEERGRAAFAGDVTERDDDPSVSERQHVVEVAADGVGRSCQSGHRRVAGPAPSPARMFGCAPVSRAGDEARVM